MANPRGTSGSGYPEDRNEFVEFYNVSSEPVDVRSWRITDFDATDSIVAWEDPTILIRYPYVSIYTTIIPANHYALILDPEYTMSNPSGGEIQPYNIPDGVVILTIGNTTIGNELQNNDPILLYSFEGDSSTFGTPFNLEDSFPSDGGDGISWERISQGTADIRQNWICSLDSTGSTPGRDNSILTYFDLSVINIFTNPSIVSANRQDTISVIIGNVGFQPANFWSVKVFNDKNRNNTEDISERLFFSYGNALAVNRETTFSFIWDSIPAGEHIIMAEINYPDDRNLANNKLSKTIYVSSVEQNFQIINNIFSPDNDGIDDSLLIQYNFTEANGKLIVLIYNLNGQLTRKLSDKKIYARSGIVSWDGKNDEGKISPIGLYVILLEYKTPNEKIHEKKSIVLAKKLN